MAFWWPFFRNGNLIFALDLSSKTAFSHVIVTTTLFWNFASRVRILIQFASQLHFRTPLMTALIANTWSTYARKMYISDISVWKFSLAWKHEFLKSVGFSHYFCEVKLVIFGPFSDRIRLRSLFGRSGLSPDSLFCRTWGPILAYARFSAIFHIFFTFSSFSLFSTAVKIVALV